MNMKTMAATSDRTEEGPPRRGFLATAAAATAGALLTAKASAKDGRNGKRSVELGVPWEASYGYVQGIQDGDTIYVSGQLSHDAVGNLIAPAPVDSNGRVTDFSNMGPQMTQAYANAAKVLGMLGASLSNVVEETLFVLDMDSAFAVAGDIRKAAYGSTLPIVTSTMLVTPRLAFLGQLIEIKFVARC